MKNLYDLLERMRERPAMYLGEKRISSLRTFIDGYHFATLEHNISSIENPPLGVLNLWMANKFGWGETSAGWNSILLIESQGDEAKALDHFFDLLPEFRKVSPQWMGSLTITQDHRTYYQTDQARRIVLSIDENGNRSTQIPIPDQVYVVEFSDQGGWYNYQLKESKLLRLDWGLGDRIEAVEYMESMFGKSTPLTEIVQSEVVIHFKKINKFC
jgi:hypothetical protein